jgi:hypothetical protein
MIVFLSMFPEPESPLPVQFLEIVPFSAPAFVAVDEHSGLLLASGRVLLPGEQGATAPALHFFDAALFHAFETSSFECAMTRSTHRKTSGFLRMTSRQLTQFSGKIEQESMTTLNPLPWSLEDRH